MGDDEAAWYASLESEVPALSPLDVVKRAAMFALASGADWPGEEPVPRHRGSRRRYRTHRRRGARRVAESWVVRTPAS